MKVVCYNACDDSRLGEVGSVDRQTANGPFSRPEPTAAREFVVLSCLDLPHSTRQLSKANSSIEAPHQNQPLHAHAHIAQSGSIELTCMTYEPACSE